MKKIFVLVLLSLLTSCNIFIDDVYSYIPKGTKLSINILKESSQIIINNNDIILLYDISKNKEDDDRAFHLLFFSRKSLTLHSATYFESSFVNSFDNNSIIAYKDEFKASKTHLYRNDLPDNYSFNYHNHDKDYTTKIKANGLIESLNFIGRWKLQIDVKRANDKYILKGKYSLDRKTISEFYKEDSLKVLLSKIIFTYNKNEVSIINTDSNKELFVDGLAIPNTNILDDFYINLLDLLKKE